MFSRHAAEQSRPSKQLSPGQLLAQTIVSSGTMTNLLDHLEARRLVRRRPDPTDARSVRMQLTAPGRRRVDAAISDLVGREDAILSALEPEERSALAALLRRVVAPFDE
jgi:DNA-binding MarR family transcriptional regulator